MSSGALKVIAARATPATALDQDRGVLAYVLVLLQGGLMLDGLALRRRTDGLRYMSYPSRTSAKGERHQIIRPVGEHARRSFERQVFAALGFTEDGK